MHAAPSEALPDHVSIAYIQSWSSSKAALPAFFVIKDRDDNILNENTTELSRSLCIARLLI